MAVYDEKGLNVVRRHNCMSNVRIGSDGSIIRDGVIVENDGRTIIREDGTIESTRLGGSINASVRIPTVLTPPVSPLENTTNRNVSNTAVYNQAASTPNESENLRRIKEKEYDIRMQDSKIRAAVPKNMIIATIVLCILGAIGLYILFIPAIVTGILIIVGFSKKSGLEKEREKMYSELDELKGMSR